MINLETERLRDGRRRATCCASSAPSSRGRADRLGLRRRRRPRPGRHRLRPRRQDARRHLRGPASRARPSSRRCARSCALLQREARHAGRHRVRLATARDLYLLQCRPQSFSQDAAPAPIPRDLPPERIVFSAEPLRLERPGARHHAHRLRRSRAATADLGDSRRAARRRPRRRPAEQAAAQAPVHPDGTGALGQPRRHQARRERHLLGHQQHGGADRDRRARRATTCPDLSFGTHFFQDLVESAIRYLPLFPDDPGIVFNELFLRGRPNILADLLPEFAAPRRHVLRVIDVPRADRRPGPARAHERRPRRGGRRPRPRRPSARPTGVEPSAARSSRRTTTTGAGGCAWPSGSPPSSTPRASASSAFYVFGSTKNATAGPASDIDLLVHFRGDDASSARRSSSGSRAGACA